MQSAMTHPAPQQVPPRIYRLHRLRKRAVGWLFTVVAAMFVLLAVAVFYRSALVNLLAPALLARAGLQELSFHVRDITPNRVQIDHVTALLPLGQDTIWLQLEGVEYDFNFRQLLAGKAERFKVVKAELSLPVWQAAGPGEQAGTREKAGISLQRLFSFVESLQIPPVEALRVENLLLHANFLGQEVRTPPLLLEYSSREEGGELLLRQVGVAEQAAPLALEFILADKVLQASIQADAAQLAAWLPLALPVQQGMVQLHALIEAHGEKSRSVQFAAQGTDVQGTGNGSSAWRAEHLELVLEATSPQDSEELIFGGESRLGVQGLVSAPMQLELGQGHIDLQGTVQFMPAQWHVHWQPQQGLVLGNVQVAGMRIASITGSRLSAQAVFPHATLQKTQPAADERGRISLGADSRIELRQLNNPAFKLDRLQGAVPVHLLLFADRQQIQWQPTAPVLLEGLKASGKAFMPLRLRDVRAQFVHTALASRLDADFRLPEAGGKFHLEWLNSSSGKQGLVDQQLTVQTPKPLQFAQIVPAQLLAQPPAAVADLQVDKGQLAAKLRLSWGKAPLTARLDVDLRDGEVQHAGMQYTGISAQQHLQVLPQLRSLRPGSVAIKAIKGPIVMDDIKATMQVQPPAKGKVPALLVQDGSLGIFDGTIQVKNCRYDPSRSTNRCTLFLNNLDAAAILALHQVEGLTVSGRMNGSIPVGLDKSGFSVANGSLHSAGAGGVIHYLPSSEALKNSPYSEYVLKALEDYRYHSLVASLTYAPDGTMLAGMQLQGRSPGLETSRPVHINLQVEQNLLSLLRSLQYSQGLTSELNRRVQQHYQPEKHSAP